MRLWSRVICLLRLLFDALNRVFKSRPVRITYGALGTLAILMTLLVGYLTLAGRLPTGSSAGPSPRQPASASTPRTAATPRLRPRRQRSRAVARTPKSPIHYAQTGGPGYSTATPAQAVQDDRYEAKVPLATKASIPTPIVHSPPSSTTPEALGKAPTSTTVHESAKVKSEATGGAEGSGNSSGTDGAESSSQVKTPTVELNSTSKTSGASTGTEAGSPGSSPATAGSAGGSASAEASFETTITH